MIVDDIKITIDFNHMTPDRAYIDKKRALSLIIKRDVPDEHRRMSLGAAISTALCQQSHSSA